jgi:hypothetical protein
MKAVKLPWLQKNGMKRVGGLVAKGVKKIGKFAIKQLQHPAVGNFIRDQAAIAASTGFNPEVAAPLMGARAAQEGLAIAERTARRFGNR